MLSSIFTALSIAQGDVSWSEENDGPVLLKAETKAFRVTVTLGVNGLDIEVFHLGREVGRAGGRVLRAFHYRLYHATYQGIKLVKKGKSVVYGSGWNVTCVQ